MAVTKRAPATLMEMATYSGARSSLQWRVAREMWRGGDTFVLSAGDEVLMLGGLYPLPDGGFEAWMHFTPTAPNHMLGIVRQVRLTLLRGSYAGTVTICRSEVGKRIAQACGFSFGAETEHGEVWVHERNLGHDYGQNAAKAATGPDAASSDIESSR